MPKKLPMKTNFVLIGIIIGLFIGVSIEQVLGEGAGVPGAVQGVNLVVNMSRQYMNGLIVANGNALVLNGKMSIGNIDPIDVLTVTGKAQSDGLCIGTSCITNWDDLKTILGIVVPPIGSTQNKISPTGITIYADETTNSANASVAVDTGDYPRQDARYARPFDYTKIANDGSTLPVTATLGTGAKDWACTKDNITGLIWEVKTTSGLRNKDYTYSWYQNNIGTEANGSCQTSGRCDTEKYVEDVKATSLCGYSDWRMPTVKELEQITDFSKYGPSIDQTYFPNTAITSSVTSSYWTSTLNSNSSQYAWIVNSVMGISMVQVDYIPQPIRLVVGAQAQEVYKPSCEVSNLSQNTNNPIASNPDNVYDTTTVPGTAIDTRSGLMWQRCSEGQTWDGNSNTCNCNAGTTWVGRSDGTNFYCKGRTYPIGEYSWSGVLKKSVNNNFAGFTDWRVPNVKELRSLVEEGCDNPSINGTIFPHTFIDAYWTSSPDVTAYLAPPNHSLVVGFNHGTINWVTRFSGSQVRFVRDVKENSSNIICSGTVPTIGTIKSSVTPTTSLPWSYNTSGAACTYTCDNTHTWNGSSCITQVAKKLPPTGITIYADDNTTTANASVAADTGAFPRQDARYNRPFDYTKIANDGSTLPSTATLGTGAKDWACTKDNITGLIWEVKTTSGLRNKDYTYTWYQNNLGKESKGSCQTSGRCDTEKFAQDVNQTSLCGFTDWRMPGVKELEGVVDFGRLMPAVDPTYFPGTQADFYWTGTTDASSNPPGYYAWAVGFGGGNALRTYSTSPLYVRLVRGTLMKSVYTSNGDGTVTDTTIGLMWKKDHEMVDPTQPSEWETGVNTILWQDALQRAVTDRTGGYSDWRLPNIKELRSLVDESRFMSLDPSDGSVRFPRALDPIFTRTPFQAWFWSSSSPTDAGGDQDMTLSVDFDYGNDLALSRGGNSRRYARLVRDITP